MEYREPQKEFMISRKVRDTFFIIFIQEEIAELVSILEPLAVSLSSPFQLTLMTQCKATNDTGAINLLRTINEPTTAAMAYGFDKNQGRK